MARKPLKRLAPRTCPQCGAAEFAIQEAGITCRRCGYTVRRENDNRPAQMADLDPNAQQAAQQKAQQAAEHTQQGVDELDEFFAELLDEPAPEATPDGPRRPYKPTYQRAAARELDPWGSAAYESALHYWNLGKWDDAERAFKRVLESSRDFVPAYLALAMLTHDEEQAEDYLTTVLAHEPGNVAATRELMILRGELDEDAADIDEYTTPEVREAGGAVGVKTKNVRCPRCGSARMLHDPLTEQLQCGSCGYVDESASSGASTVGGLTAALLKRRSQPVVWEVGERLLECQSCGAQRTLAREVLTQECPFCSSQHVITRDALNSFQQPDSIVPFRMTLEEARQALDTRLGSWTEKIAGLFGENRAERIQFEGVYLPFWVFDASLQVRRTITRDNNSIGLTRDSNRYSPSMQPSYETETIADAVHSVEIAAVSSPPLKLTRELGDYPVGNARPYAPKLLGGFPAELYDIDFDAASLEARSVIGEEMREKHRYQVQAARGNSVNVTIFTEFQQMQFQLVLLPVWVATIHERDDDIRTALINGVTGRIALGKARKPGTV